MGLKEWTKLVDNNERGNTARENHYLTNVKYEAGGHESYEMLGGIPRDSCQN